ncbi:MAG: hypothetical protein CFH41_01399 [Alphaproteobacteria bacterium MarineAlpha11_Bin1]|nr:MAG: hypothetical protein CFH41_01399 [Alphaproteobacteria bacterium MarineAlpha11_Bin1]|tara:strand:- start:4945 stop:5133 length:189 start_codon:yes stop_codon:yes gene_type:complete
MALMPPTPEIVEVETVNVSCDGGGGTLGHPKVYLTLVDGQVECPYCDARFILKSGIAQTYEH